jgi:hypothetical protein
MKKFLPFMTGVYTTAPGLMPQAKEGNNIFDADENYNAYIENKRRCREEDITKYYCTHDFKEQTRDAVINFLQSQINQATGDFDVLCRQVQEDVAVVQLEGDKDWLAAIHLCSPNHWDPRTKIGRPFNEIHMPVPHIERTVKNYQVMLKMIIDKEPFTRFAWGISTDDRLNHHPEPPVGYDPEEWRGRKFSDQFFVRVERQNLIGLKEVNAFIFTIRTYFYNVEELNSEERKALATAISSMTKESLDYKGMSEFKTKLLSLLAK